MTDYFKVKPESG